MCTSGSRSYITRAHQTCLVKPIWAPVLRFDENQKLSNVPIEVSRLALMNLNSTFMNAFTLIWKDVLEVDDLVSPDT
eukprot:6212745-Pleurochrysis_carterae.AAC.6